MASSIEPCTRPAAPGFAAIPVLAALMSLVLLPAIACTGTIGSSSDAGFDDVSSELGAQDGFADAALSDLADGTVADGGPNDVPAEVPSGDVGDDLTGDLLGDVATDAPGGETLVGIYERLRPACVDCHNGVWDKGFFNSLEAFNNLLVLAKSPDGQRLYVVPGDPNGSELVALLEGQGAGNYPAMPTDVPFAVSAAGGETEISMAEIKDWILGMSDAPPVDDSVPTDVRLVRRLRADQLVAALYGALGLGDEDFWNMAVNYGYYEVVGNGFNDNLPMRDPARTPNHTVNSNLRATATERWFALGGPDYMSGRSRNQDITPAFVQTITQVSQAWCRLAIKKSGNDAVLKHADLSHASASDEALIRQNIAYLHLRFLGDPAPSEDVDALFADVFQVYEAFSNTEAAWTAVCATLVRDPRFLTY